MVAREYHNLTLVDAQLLTYGEAQIPIGSSDKTNVLESTSYVAQV